jgi:hypothetical protein
MKAQWSIRSNPKKKTLIPFEGIDAPPINTQSKSLEAPHKNKSLEVYIGIEVQSNPFI